MPSIESRLFATGPPLHGRRHPSEVHGAARIKSAALTLVAVVLRSTDLAVLAQDLAEREATTPGLFDNDAVAMDLWRVRESADRSTFSR